MKKHALVIFFAYTFLAGSFFFNASAQNNSFGVSDSTYNYYNKSLAHIFDVKVLDMMDTLFIMAGKEGDVRMQNVALSTKMDHYFYTGERDSMLVHAERTKAFARAHNMPRYYYFAWSRVITYYIKIHYLQTAMIETEKMQEEALKEGNYVSIMQAYQMMGRLYNDWSRNRESAEYFIKAAELMEDPDKGDPQYLPFLYSTASTQYSIEGDFEKAEKYLSLARRQLFDTADSASVYSSYLRMYIEWEKPEMAKIYLDSLKSINYPIQNNVNYLGEEMRYYYLIKDYKKAMEACNGVMEILNDGGENSYSYYAAQFNEKMGLYKEAASSYARYVSYLDSTNKYKFAQELSEQAILLNVNEITAQKQELEIRLRTRWLIFAVSALIILTVVLLILSRQFNKIKALNRRLEKSESIKTIFLQNLSHEVRTPMNSIMGFADIMSTTPNLTKREYEDYSGIVLKNSRQLFHLFNDALTASDIKSIKELKIVNINDICRRAVNNNKEDCLPGVEMKFIPCVGDTNIMIDQDDIYKLVNNILNNSVKFTKAGSITLKTDYLSRSKFMISVTDTGPGIPADMHEKVFDSFYKVDELAQGVGLGLTICKMIADSMKGSISIDSSYTDGCRIIFVFPV